MVIAIIAMMLAMIKFRCLAVIVYFDIEWPPEPAGVIPRPALRR